MSRIMSVNTDNSSGATRGQQRYRPGNGCGFRRNESADGTLTPAKTESNLADGGALPDHETGDLDGDVRRVALVREVGCERDRVLVSRVRRFRIKQPSIAAAAQPLDGALAQAATDALHHDHVAILVGGARL